MKFFSKRRKPNRTKNHRSRERIQKRPLMEDLSGGTRRVVAAVASATLAVVLALALLGLAGPLGVKIASWVKALFGHAAVLLPLALALEAYLIIKDNSKNNNQDKPQDTHPPFGRIMAGLVFAWLGFTGLLHLAFSSSGADLWATAAAGSGGGYIGGLFAYIFYSTLGKPAAMLILASVGFIGILISANWSPKIKTKQETLVKPGDQNPTKPNGFISDKIKAVTSSLQLSEKPKEVPNTKPDNNKPKEEITGTGEKQIDIQMNPGQPTHDDWLFPPFDLLQDVGAKADSGNVEAGAAIIQQTLKNFGIEVEMGEVNQGPTVTQYTLRPATGVKLSQIAALRQDIALALAAKSLRMELPIPGKALVGIEVPNRTSALVGLRSILQTSEFINDKSPLVFALGQDVAGRPQTADLAKLPHLLIAGSTGSGKSVAINTFIISLLYHNSPRSVKLILVDPKRVELTLYQGLPHLLTSPITQAEKAVNALRWAVAEMDRRYENLARAGKRNIAEFNAISGEPLPYIVIIVDELADLMAVAGRDMESVIVRLAQMARAVGIHLVLATQRPSVDILTGLIKANITARMAFAVASGIDSRTILDTGGAEQLLGNGDMLFISADQAKPRRVQGAYIGEAEARKVVDFCKRQVGAVIYDDSVTQRKQSISGVPGAGEETETEDALLEEAKQEVMRAGKASASLLQRRLRIGYSRAARLLDLLEAAGVVGPQDGAKPREVFGASSSEQEEVGEVRESNNPTNEPDHY